MFMQSFAIILDSMQEIEENLKNNPDDNEKERLINSLLNLRNIMDQCVKYWLVFEEKVNELQKKYNFNLPDVLPDGFLQDIEFKNEKNVEFPTSADCLPPKNENTGKQSFIKLESEQGIDSFRKGLGFWDLAMLEEAINEFEKVIKLEPNFIFGHFCLGLAYSQKGLYNQALSKLRLVKALSRDLHLNAFVHNAIGNIYANEKQYEEALDEFILSVEEDPCFYIGYFNMGAIYFNLRRYRESIEAFEKVKAAMTYDWEVCYCLGRAYTLAGEFIKALQNFKKALSLNPTEPKILFEMGVLYDLLGDKKNASYCFNSITKKVN
ncbi:MAG: tetratricopeptide repeat protein [Dethiobacter sp.]|jgi:tetratricopeptide (TPR) repeat protein|nr:MAG: tetratricopeptide repeat protein [Dethiobacter sp.]